MVMREQMLHVAAQALNESKRDLQLTLDYEGPLGDSTKVFFVRRKARKPHAVVLLSPAGSPSIVHEAMRRARTVAEVLPPHLASRVLLPIARGFVDQRSYAVLPYCYQLSRFHPLWAVQRRILRSVLIKWLGETARVTVAQPKSSEIEVDFAEPLRRLADSKKVSPRLRMAAESAATRLASRQWLPKYVLMHGDFWRGNIMIRPPRPGFHERWQDRIVLIDWLGARLAGYPIFDLMRILRDLKFSRSAARRELQRHCEILECESQDLHSHLCAALAHIHANLNEFPFHQFLTMSESCFDTLSFALATTKR
jgi:hypothetical protein